MAVFPPFVSLGVAKGNYTLRDWLNVELFELHRFPTNTIQLPSGLHWDIGGIWREILNGLLLVAGWASVAQPLEGQAIWDLVADYLRAKKTVRVSDLNVPILKGVEGNPGLEM